MHMLHSSFKLLTYTVALFLSESVYADQNKSDRELQKQRFIEKVAADSKMVCKEDLKPCKKFLGSSNESPEEEAYRESILSKIYKLGNDNYPTELASVNEYQLIVFTIEIDRSGELRRVTLLKKSKNQRVNKYAKELINKAAPYPSFKGVFESETDIVVITSAMYFNLKDKKAGSEKTISKLKNETGADALKDARAF